jgi:hypothetical protein
MIDVSTALRVATGLGSLGYSAEKGQLEGVIAGDVWWVDSNGTGAGATASVPGTFEQPFSTLTYAISRATASKGDVIFVKPGHAETTTAIAWSKAGVKVVGLGYGRNRPTFTATTAATDLINISAANAELRNVRLVGAASGNTALVDVAAADARFYDVSFEPAATPLMSVTLAAGSARPWFINCQWQVSANGPDCAIDIETSDSDYGRIIDCLMNASGFGWDLGVIRAAADAAVGWQIKNTTIISADTVAIDFNSSAGASGVDGIVEDCTFVATAALASVEDILDTGRYIFKECYAHDITNFTTACARIPLGTVS